jgi:hypothetical protein
MIALHHYVHFECVNYIERRQRLVELVMCFTSVILLLRAHRISNKNSFTSKITSGTPKFQMAILNQEIKMKYPLKYLLIAHGYRNPFYIEWVFHYAIFYFPLAREILKYTLSLGHTPDFFLLSCPL